MSLLEKNRYLFEANEVDFDGAVREFMIEDEKRNFRFLNIVYDKEDFDKYR